jgi:hypothetical protein
MFRDCDSFSAVNTLASQYWSVFSETAVCFCRQNKGGRTARRRTRRLRRNVFGWNRKIVNESLMF